MEPTSSPSPESFLNGNDPGKNLPDDLYKDYFEFNPAIDDNDDDYDVPDDLTESPTTNPTSYTISQPAFGANLDTDDVYDNDDDGVSLLPDTKPPS
eukprot:5240298-Ditylum_brightwellii.AAC.1